MFCLRYAQESFTLFRYPLIAALDKGGERAGKKWGSQGDQGGRALRKSTISVIYRFSQHLPEDRK